MPGAAVHIYSADDYAGARVTITNNRITNSGWGILAESNLAGGTFQDNVLDGNSIALKIAYTTGWMSVTTSSVGRSVCGSRAHPTSDGLEPDHGVVQLHRRARAVQSAMASRRLDACPMADDRPGRRGYRRDLPLTLSRLSGGGPVDRWRKVVVDAEE
jgi:parallel beta-helix repeat protein